jgi:hypothetical protein
MLQAAISTLTVFFLVFFWVEEAYTQQGRANARVFLAEGAYVQQGRAHIRRLHPDPAARPALMRRAAHQ